jgi:hypothetical protein
MTPVSGAVGEAVSRRVMHHRPVLDQHRARLLDLLRSL